MSRPTAGTAYDATLTREARKTRGVYYTPAAIAAEMTALALRRHLAECGTVDELERLRICDPSCGDGVFLRAALAALLERATQLGARATPRLVQKIQKRCLFGVDLDGQALALAAATLPWANLEREDSLRRPSATDRFDVVIGNPPYGASTGLSGESTRLFIAHALDSLAPRGTHAFIVPKALLHSSTWAVTLERLLPGLAIVVDCGTVWPEVKLEQVIYLFDGASDEASYRTGRLVGERIVEGHRIPKKTCAEFGFALHGVSPAEVRLARRLAASGVGFGRYLTNARGAALQSRLEPRGGAGLIPALGGKQLGRYSMSDDAKGYVRAASVDARARVREGAILAQNIVAHVGRPEPHLKIAATIAPRGSRAVILDTVNQLLWSGPGDAEAALAILNSKLVSWYVYRFIVGKAVRTIHFDARVTSRIPLPSGLEARGRELGRLAAAAREMLARPSAELDAEIDRLVCGVYDLGEGEARAVRV